MKACDKHGPLLNMNGRWLVDEAALAELAATGGLAADDADPRLVGADPAVGALMALAATPLFAADLAPLAGVDAAPGLALLQAHWTTLPVSGARLREPRSRYLSMDCLRRSPLDGPRETRSHGESGRSRPTTGCSAMGREVVVAEMPHERLSMSHRQDLPVPRSLPRSLGGSP
jgi:hypothetical protein